MSRIKAIETVYKGYRFRSRLEARWAVFFDALGIEWEYEHQGYMVDRRITGWSVDYSDVLEGRHIEGASAFPYLPDFWLPRQQMFVEVKGSLSDSELVDLLDAAAFLSSNGGIGCHDNGGHDLVVLGSIPPPDSRWSPCRLHMHKGLLCVGPVNDLPREGGARCPAQSLDFEDIASDNGDIYFGDAHFKDAYPTIARLLLKGIDSKGLSNYSAALAAARGARFEHGETPQLPKAA